MSHVNTFKKPVWLKKLKKFKIFKISFNEFEHSQIIVYASVKVRTQTFVEGALPKLILQEPEVLCNKASCNDIFWCYGRLFVEKKG